MSGKMNKTAASRTLSVFLCPSETVDNRIYNSGNCNYVANAGWTKGPHSVRFGLVACSKAHPRGNAEQPR